MTEAEYELRRQAIDEKYWRFRHEIEARESVARDVPWIDGALIPVCGIDIRIMSFQDHLALSLSGNAFLNGGAIWPADIFDFLWFLSPRYHPTSRFKKYLNRRKLKGNMATAKEEIESYLNDVMQDLPVSKKGKANPVEVPASWILNIVHVVAGEYGIDPNEVKRWPIPQVLQTYHQIASRSDKYFHVGTMDRLHSANYILELDAIEKERVG